MKPHLLLERSLHGVWPPVVAEMMQELCDAAEQTDLLLSRFEDPEYRVEGCRESGLSLVRALRCWLCSVTYLFPQIILTIDCLWKHTTKLGIAQQEVWGFKAPCMGMGG